MRKSAFALMAFALSVTHASSGFAQRGGGAVVSTAFVEEEVVSDTTNIAGAMIASAPIIVSALRAGETVISDLQVGDFIRKGTKIAEQNSDDLQYDLALLELQLKDANARLEELAKTRAFNSAQLAVAQQQLSLLSQKEQRSQQLLEKKAISQEAAETVKSARLNAEQQFLNRQQTAENAAASQGELERNVERLKVQINRLKDRIADTIYQAPVNGLILSLPNYKTGFARQGDNLIAIQGFSGFEVQAEIPAAYLPLLRETKKIAATAQQNNDLSLSFRAALPTENQRTATRPVRFSIEGELPRQLYADGARIDLSVPITKAAPVLLVPQDAIVPVAGGHVVFVFDEGTAVRQIVRLGGAVDDQVIVQAGLQAGEKVIIKGNEGLSNGAAVKEGTPPKRKVPSGEAQAEVEVVEAVIETELADDAVEWLLEWSTPRGDSEATLTLSSKAKLYEGEPIAVTLQDDAIQFEAERVLPFGILTFAFDGKITGKTMEGTLTLSGLPNGRTPNFPFTGKVK